MPQPGGHQNHREFLVSLKMTWFQRLPSGLLFTFMNPHFFQFRFAGTEQSWQPS